MSRLRAIAAHVLGVQPAELSDTSNFRDFPQWDSVAHVEIVLLAESEFGVAFDPEEAVELVSISALEDGLRRKGIEIE